MKSESGLHMSRVGDFQEWTTEESVELSEENLNRYKVEIERELLSDSMECGITYRLSGESLVFGQIDDEGVINIYECHLRRYATNMGGES